MDKIEKLAQARENLVDDIELRHNNRLNIALENLERDVVKIAKDHGAMVCLDGAQSTPHMKVDVQDLGIDFMAFSIHKMMGPSGMGGLWGRMDLLEGMRSINSGGSTVDTSHYDSLTWSKPQQGSKAD